MESTSLIVFLENIVGTVPSEFESLIYVICIIVLLYIIDGFFSVLTSIFGVSKWKR